MPAKPKTDKTTRKVSSQKFKEVSIVQFLNVKKVERKTDLMRLLTHVVQNYTRDKSILVQAKTTVNTIEYRVLNKRVALALATKAQAAFKQHHPTVTVTTPNDGAYCRITVEFN
ncbi:MAG: hypothetical protein ACD_41C00070G0002 [uncultured bacterium]|nr:MAG: hypothetical protein ACD_41C00070G0002 [uncultured bacterium]HBY73300.1 hypothetical protein [Candidatus Kerfeldbacteria bacterium]